jgi:hypothetical protein
MNATEAAGMCEECKRQFAYHWVGRRKLCLACTPTPLPKEGLPLLDIPEPLAKEGPPTTPVALEDIPAERVASDAPPRVKPLSAAEEVAWRRALGLSSEEPRCACGARAGDPHSRVCPEWKQIKYTKAISASDGPRDLLRSQINAQADNVYRQPQEASLLDTAVKYGDVIRAVLAEVARLEAAGHSLLTPLPREIVAIHVNHAAQHIIEAMRRKAGGAT